MNETATIGINMRNCPFTRGESHAQHPFRLVHANLSTWCVVHSQMYAIYNFLDQRPKKTNAGRQYNEGSLEYLSWHWSSYVAFFLRVVERDMQRFWKKCAFSYTNVIRWSVNWHHWKQGPSQAACISPTCKYLHQQLGEESTEVNFTFFFASKSRPRQKRATKTCIFSLN